MMYQAWIMPGKKPRQQSARLMRESALQMPLLTHTVPFCQCCFETNSATKAGCGLGFLPPMGGKRKERSMRKQSVPHMLNDGMCAEAIVLRD